jgi:GTP pyrophosphokinase
LLPRQNIETQIALIPIMDIDQLVSDDTDALEQAILFAVAAHEGDTDKADETYIRHPLRLMEKMDTKQERIVAVLHDVVEDSEYELDTIKEDFGPEIRDAVAALTKSDDEDYLEEYIPRLVKNDIARKVKAADLRDNLDLTRLSELDEDMWDNIQKYHRSLQLIENS